MVMYNDAPPKLSPPKAPNGLSIATGVAGLGVAVGAAPSGFLTDLANNGRLDFFWGDTMLIAFVLALVGAVLALSCHEAGPPIVAGASAVAIAVVGSTAVSERVDIADLLDALPLRGGLFFGGGGAALFGVVLGLMCLRGRASVALGVVISLLSLVTVAGIGASLHIDDNQDSRVVIPVIGFGVIAVVSIVGAFVGRFGTLAAATASACLIPLFINAVDFANDREYAVQAALFASIGVVALSMVAIAIGSHQVAPQVVDEPYTFVQPAPSTDQFPVVQPDDDITVPLQPQPFESSFFDAEPAAVTTAAVTTAAVSTVGQWAPDPYGRHELRYWDGNRWTDHVSSNGANTIDPV